MPRVNDAGLMEGQLIERQRGDRVDPPGHGQLGGCREELEGRAAGAGVDLSRGNIGQTARNTIDGQARNDAWRWSRPPRASHEPGHAPMPRASRSSAGPLEHRRDRR